MPAAVTGHWISRTSREENDHDTHLPEAARCRQVEQQGQTSGVGMVAGGVLGGVLGHQIGSGRGNTVATIAGAGVGAYAGNQVEKNQKKSTYWAVTIRMDNGATRNFTYTNRPAVNQGERVKLVDGGRRLALVAN
jgi:outer membrane lipoprotein SlyB